MKLKTIAALLALPLLAACAPEIESSIYVRDLMKVSGTGFTVPAILRVPQGSKEECEKGLQQLITNLATLAPTTGKGKCVEKSRRDTTDQLAEIETEMVIVSPNSEYEGKHLFLLEVAPTAAGEATNQYDLTFRLLKPIDEIVTALSAGSDQMQVEFDPALFIFTINNDSDADVSLLPNQVFLDGEPGLPELGPVTLAKRQDVEIKFSDVASAYVEKGEGFRFATITLPE